MLAVARVADRVLGGGHNVPEATIRRRYDAGLRNFFTLYSPIAATWEMMDNSEVGATRVVAAGHGNVTDFVAAPVIWKQIRTEFLHGG